MSTMERTADSLPVDGGDLFDARVTGPDKASLHESTPDLSVVVRAAAGTLIASRDGAWLCRARARTQKLPRRQGWIGGQLLVLDQFIASEANVLNAEGAGALPILRELLRSAAGGAAGPWHVLRVSAGVSQDAVVGAAWRLALELELTCETEWGAEDGVWVTIYGRGARSALASISKRVGVLPSLLLSVRSRLRRIRVLGRVGKPRSASLYYLELRAPISEETVSGLEFRTADLQTVSRRPLQYADSVQGAELPLQCNEVCVVGELDHRTVFRMWVGAIQPEWLGTIDPRLTSRRARYVHESHTAPGYRNRGIYAAALRWLASRSRDLGYEVLWMHVMPDNVPAIRSAEKVGFRPISRELTGSTGTSSPQAGEAQQRRGIKLDGPGVMQVIQEVISVAGTVRVRAAGNSMWPTIGNGAIVTLVPTSESIKPGQIVLLNWNGRPVLHRVLKVSGGMVHTIGDACIDPDPPTKRTDVIARATTVIDRRGEVTLTGSPTLGVRSWSVYSIGRMRLGLARQWRWLRSNMVPTQ